MQKIKSISRYVATVSDPFAEVDEWLLKSYRELDEEGRELLDVHYDANGEIESKTVQTYNDKGQLVEHITYFSEHEIAEHFQFEYTENGNIVKQIIRYADGSISIKSFARDKLDLLIEIRDDEDELEGTEFRRFNDQGNLLEEWIKDETGSISSRSLHEYNSEGQLVLKTEFGEDDETISKIYYKYDEHGNQIESLTLTENNEVKTRRISTFNDQNQLFEENVDGFKISYEYDESGNRIRDEIIDPHQNTESFSEYYYDDNQQLEKTISCQKGNMAYTSEDAVKGGKLAAFLISRYEYEYFPQE
ncbi:RHS repeat domain-containing protein [Bacteroidota bacterium]